METRRGQRPSRALCPLSASGSRAKPLKAAQARKEFHERLQRPTQLYPVFTKDHPSRPSLPQVHGLTSRSLHRTLNPLCTPVAAAAQQALRRLNTVMPASWENGPIKARRAGGCARRGRGCGATPRLQGLKPSNPLRLGYWGPWFLGVVAPRVRSEPSEKGLSSGVGRKNMKKQKA